MHRVVSIWVLGVLILVGVSGCAATQQAKSVEKSGFLDQKTYSMTTEGNMSSSFFSDREEDQALLIYINPNAQWTRELGPNTLWFQVAVTEAGKSNVVLDTISSLIPQAKLLSGVKSLATGVSAFSGEVSAE